MKYLKSLGSFFDHNVEHYTLAQYKLSYSRWRVIGLISLFIFLYLVFSTTGVGMSDRVNHIAKVPVSLNPLRSAKLESQLNNVLRDSKVKGVMLFVEEGIYDGGNFSLVESLGNLIEKIKLTKPVVAFIYGYAQSNSYVLATSADYIVSQETASLGGLSATSISYDTSSLMQKVGIEVIEQGFGDYKTRPSKDDPNYAKFMAHRSKVLETLHKWMLDKVIKNRGLGPDKFVQIADGQWYLGRRAISIGLCDTLGDQHTALDWLGVKLGYTKDEKLPVIEYSSAEEEQHDTNPFLGKFLQSSMLKSCKHMFEQYLYKKVTGFVSSAIHTNVHRIDV